MTDHHVALDTRHAADRLEANADAFRALFRNVPGDQAIWRPAPKSWSLLEVACHLLDEEREDFRKRLELVLANPDEAWPPIDPVGWVLSKDYASRDLGATVAAFMEERHQSVAWLRGLSRVALGQAHRHPKLGELRAGDLLGAWLAHDLLHLRQVARLHYEHTTEIAKPYSLAYAGSW